MITQKSLIIYFDDFCEKAQKQILEIYKISRPEEMNWDALPMFELPVPDEMIEVDNLPQANPL